MDLIYRIKILLGALISIVESGLLDEVVVNAVKLYVQETITALEETENRTYTLNDLMRFSFESKLAEIKQYDLNDEEREVINHLQQLWEDHRPTLFDDFLESLGDTDG